MKDIKGGNPKTRPHVPQRPTSSGKYIHSIAGGAITRERNSMLSLGTTLNRTTPTKCSIPVKEVFYGNPKHYPTSKKQPNYLQHDSQRHVHTLEFELRPKGLFVKLWHLDKDANQYNPIAKFKFYEDEPLKLKVILLCTFVLADADFSYQGTLVSRGERHRALANGNH